MSARPVILYAGGFPLPDHRASALRAIDNAKLFQAMGMEPIVLGRFVASHDGRRARTGAGERAEVAGIECRNIEVCGGVRPRTYLSSAKPVQAVLEEVGAERVRAIIAYNYPARGLADLLRLSQNSGVPLVAECTEWAGLEGRDLVRGVTRELGARYRIGILAQRAGHVICATRFAAAHFHAANVLVLPWVLHETASAPSPSGEVVRFVYAGSPGRRFSKERIDCVIEALAHLADHPRPFVMECSLTREEVLADAPHLAPALERLGERLVFRGWLGRGPLHDLLSRSDVSVFARIDRRSSRFGFPTKLAEAYRYGLPVVTNPTGDVGEYLAEGCSGWLAADPSPSALAAALARALETPADTLGAMKRGMLAANPFAPSRYRAAAAGFFTRIEAERALRQPVAA